MPSLVDQEVAANKLPLGELKLTVVDEDKVTHKIPALHKHWLKRQIYDKPLPIIWSSARISSDVELAEWLHGGQALYEDLQFLLNCKHHEFWSHMVFEKTALRAIVLFLQRAIPFYMNAREEVNSRNSTVIELYEELLSMVVRIICRLVTCKESPQDYLTKEHWRELIYSNYLISVPMLCDLVIAVGDTDAKNSSILRRVFESVLHLEPKYKGDLLSAIAFFREAFRSIQTQAENEGFEGACGGSVDDQAETVYDDVALYALDCAYTLAVLLEVCPVAVELCNELKMAHSIAKFYDTTLPYLYKNICLINEQASSLSWINQARLQYLRAFRSLSNAYIEAVLHKPEESLEPADAFIGLLTECLSEQMFVVDYASLYPVSVDMEILTQACQELDQFKAAFVVEGYQRESAAVENGTFGNVAINSEPTIPKQPKKPEKLEKVEDKVATSNGDVGVERDLDAETQSVLEVLPHLGNGFVRRVLLRYNNSEEAISAILEANLPPDLANRDQSEPLIPIDPSDRLFHETGIRHYNVHDGDAYDIMSRDNPDCIIKQGKGMPNGPRNMAELLDDKKDLAAVRHIYEEYNLVSEDEYDDEYDDSYEALLDSENRSMTKSKFLRAGMENVLDVSDDEDDNEETEAPNDSKNEQQSNKDGAFKKPMDFCENPEAIRARYEAHRQAKYGNRQTHGNTSSQKTHDVVGAPKGQGQEKGVVKSRQKKEANKSSRANHNRKAGASFKRSKGMFP